MYASLPLSFHNNWIAERAELSQQTDDMLSDKAELLQPRNTIRLHAWFCYDFEITRRLERDIQCPYILLKKPRVILEKLWLKFLNRTGLQLLLVMATTSLFCLRKIGQAFRRRCTYYLCQGWGRRLKKVYLLLWMTVRQRLSGDLDAPLH